MQPDHGSVWRYRVAHPRKVTKTHSNVPREHWLEARVFGEWAEGDRPKPYHATPESTPRDVGLRRSTLGAGPGFIVALRRKKAMQAIAPGDGPRGGAPRDVLRIRRPVDGLGGG